MNQAMQLLNLLKSGNPRAAAEQIIAQNYPNDPQMQYLLQLGQKGDYNTLKNYAQQLLNQNGLNVDSALNNLINTLNNSGR